MSLRKQAISGLVWTFASQFGTQLIGFVVSMILARILLPEEFGLIGMIVIFIAVGNTLLDAGLTQSLIRSQDLDQEDFSTVFFFNVAVSILIYIAIYLSAPFIANFYDQQILINIIRLFCITFIINSFKSVQLARLTKKMDFKTQTLIDLPSTVVGGIVGVTMAYTGYGVWSLVWSSLVSSFLGSLQLWIYSKWIPSLVFNIEKFKDHFNYGYKLTLSELLDTIFSNIYLIIIGKFFSSAQVGFYTRAQTMKQLPVNNISNALNKVTFPLFVSIQDDNVRLKKVYKQLMQMVIFIIAPVLIFLGVLAEPTFRLLFTEKWLPAVPYFQILCATGILYPIHAYNLNILKVKGRSDLFLKLDIIKKTLIVIGIIIGIQFGIYGLLYAQVILSVSAFLINSYYTDKFISYSAWEQLKDILPTIIISGISGLIIWFVDVNLKDQIDIFRIIIGVLMGSGTYLLISYILKLQSLYDLIKLLKRQ